jgi:sialate O-acetylesterase
VTVEAGKKYALSAEIDLSSNGWLSFGYAARAGNASFYSSPAGYGTAIVKSGNVSVFAGKGTAGAIENLGLGKGHHQLKIILDATSANVADWTLSFFCNGNSVTNVAVAKGDLADIKYVGFSTSDASVAGTIKRFKLTSEGAAHVRLSNLFGDHMVLQRDQPVPVWGTAEPGEKVTVEFAGQKKTAMADSAGTWRVLLDPMPASSKPRKMTVSSTRNSELSRLEFSDVLVGEVWVCSGQSNMAWPLSKSAQSNEFKRADFPNIRLISVPAVGTQEPQHNFKGSWSRCSSETVPGFSAVGYLFGRELYQKLDVPIGLINDAWGGSALEAWIPRDALVADEAGRELLEHWVDFEGSYDYPKAMKNWKVHLEKWEKGGKKGRKPGPPRNHLSGNHRPANIYNGVVYPTIGYGMRGVIWYQGESNASRATQYRTLFPLLIESWREAWGQGDFPFYYVQLANYKAAVDQPGESEWAELREAQTMTLSKVKNTGQAVIIDAGEADDIHPGDKQTVAERLARWALVKDYGMEIVCQSPTFASMKIKKGKALLNFDHVGAGLSVLERQEPVGFAIAGEDREFVWAQARVVGANQVEVWSDEVADPVSVRYAWADNPQVNLYSHDGLPVTPFRTDSWDGMTLNEKLPYFFPKANTLKE